jgi:hypothetical protein
VNDWKDKLAHRIARLLPRRVLKWAFVVVAANALCGEYRKTAADEVTLVEALKAWEK